jgi:hypothetical protein
MTVPAFPSIQKFVLTSSFYDAKFTINIKINDEKE